MNPFKKVKMNEVRGLGSVNIDMNPNQCEGIFEDSTCSFSRSPIGGEVLVGEDGSFEFVSDSVSSCSFSCSSLLPSFHPGASKFLTTTPLLTHLKATCFSMMNNRMRRSMTTRMIEKMNGALQPNLSYKVPPTGGPTSDEEWR